VDKKFDNIFNALLIALNWVVDLLAIITFHLIINHLRGYERGSVGFAKGQNLICYNKNECKKWNED
jgi:hypothetical protein